MKKILVVKDWFVANKIKEHYGKMRFFTNRVWAVVAESEKAVRVVCASEATGYNTFWAPKSLLDIEEVQEWEDGEEVNAGKLINPDTTIDSLIKERFMTSEEAWESFNDMMDLYR